MATVDKLPDLVLENILDRLPRKSWLVCRCVSKHWNRLITDPYFMKSRARRRVIFITGYELLDLVDDPTDHSMLTLSSRYEPWRSKGCRVRKILGTINGIVLFQCSYGGGESDYMLYNLFTRNYMLLPPASYARSYAKPDHLSWSESHDITYAYGFGYGYSSATPDDDLKIVRFREFNKRCHFSGCVSGFCEIFSLKEFTWSKPRDMNIKHIVFETTVGTFLNGFLYWIPERLDKLIVLDVAKIVLFELDLPFQRSYNSPQRSKRPQWSNRSHLGTIHGCLCLLNRSMNDIDYNLWVMNDQADENSWSIRCSFTLAKDVGDPHHQFICILDNGRILMRVKKQLHIYDPSDDEPYTLTDGSISSDDEPYTLTDVSISSDDESYTLTDVSISSDDESYTLTDYVSISSEYDISPSIQGIEYIETLVSLSDACSASHRSSS